MAMLATDDPLGSRLFIVCGRSVEEDTIKAAFLPYGNVQNIKLIKDKGVCYVKYDKASSAALAMESLNGAVLNNGRGPKLKVLLAEAPTPRGAQQTPKLLLPEEQQASTDPDNIPPRSRLFLVVPKTAEARLIHDELSRYPDLEYCKTDLIASKGVVFVKYSRASSALRALEDIAAKGMLASYKVKVMLAEPKTKRQRPDQLAAMGLFGPVGALAGHLPPLGLDAAGALRLAPAAAAAAAGGQFGAYGLNAAQQSAVLAAQQAAALSGAAPDYAQLQGFVGFNNASNLAAAAAAAAAAGGGPGIDLSNQLGLGYGLGSGNLMQQLTPQEATAMSSAAGMTGQLTQAAAAAAAAGAGSGGSGAFQSSPGNTSMGSVNSAVTNFQLGPFMGLSPGGAQAANPMMAAAAQQQQQFMQPGVHDLTGAAGPPLSQQRLFVVVHKSVSEDQLKLLFRQYPGMEYCDLKRDKATGKSKGYCYVNYSTPAAAAAAVNDLNGIEFPVGSGFRLKVMFAEIMTGGSGGGSSSSSAALNLLRSNSSRSSIRTPSAGQLGALVRAGSGPLAHQHSSSSGMLVQPGMGAVGSQLAAAVAGSGPSSAGTGGLTAAAAMGGSRGPSPAATPLHHSHHHHQQQQRSFSGSELAHVAESLSSMSLPTMSAAMTPTMVNIGSGDHSADAVAAAAAAAAAAHHFGDLDGSAAAVGAGPVGSSVARELMFNVC